MAYALVTGSTYAMVGAISSMDSAAKSASASAAAQAASGNVNLGNDSMHNYSAANKSMDNLSAMDVSTGNTNRNNRSIGNVNKNGLSEIVDGSVINGKSTNPNEVTSIMSQNGLTESQKVGELAKSGSFTGSVTGQSGEGLSTYNIANGVVTEQSTANGFNTSQVITKGVGGKTVAGTAIKKGIGKPGQLISLNAGSSKTYTENLNAAQAKKMGLPGAGAYTFSKTANGQEVAVRGSNGAVVSGLTKNGYAGTTTSVLNPKTGKFGPVYTQGNKGIDFNKNNIKDKNYSRLYNKHTGYRGSSGYDQKNYYGVTENKYGPSYDYGNAATSGLTGYIAAKKGMGASAFMDKNSIAEYDNGLTSKSAGQVQYTRSQIIDAGAKVFGQKFQQSTDSMTQLVGELGVQFKNTTSLGFKLFGSGDKASIEVTAGGKIVGLLNQKDLSEASMDLYKQKAYDSFAKNNPTTVQQAKGLLLQNQAGANVTMLTSAEGIINKMLKEKGSMPSSEKGETPYVAGRFGPVPKN